MKIGALLRMVRMEIQVEKHFWSVALRSIVRVAYWIVGDMSKEGFVSGKVIIAGRIIYGEYCMQWR